MNNLELGFFGLTGGLMGLTAFLAIQALAKPRKQYHLFLAVFYAAIFVTYFDDLIFTLDLWKTYPWFTNGYIPVLYIIPPAYYLYIRGLTKPEKIMAKSKNIAHLTGFIISLALCIPYFLFDQELKLQRLSAAPGTLEHLGYITWGPTIALLMVIPFSLFYLVLCFRQIKHHVTNIKQLFSNIENKDLSWIRWSLIILFVALLLSFLQLFNIINVIPTQAQNLYFAVAQFLWLSSIGVLSIQQKPIYTNKNKVNDKYERSKLDEAEANKIEQRLKLSMQEERLYQEPDLTLRQLSDHLGFSAHKISQILNSRMGKGFYDYINALRIQRACELINQTNKTILDIAYEVGFNSRSTFNSAFKKHTEQTPSQFKKQLQTKR
ncbi:helix-turn-helix domain-containing protein [Kangiella sp. M94]